MDEAIREMNAEMEELFGGSYGDVRAVDPMGSAMGGAMGVAMGGATGGAMGGAMGNAWQQQAPQPVPAQPQALPGANPQAQSVALDALSQKIQWCAAELMGTTDVERSTKLATCMAECARAAAALKGGDLDR